MLAARRQHVSPDLALASRVRQFSELSLYTSSVAREKVTLQLPLIIVSSSTPLEKEKKPTKQTTTTTKQNTTKKNPKPLVRNGCTGPVLVKMLLTASVSPRCRVLQPDTGTGTDQNPPAAPIELNMKPTHLVASSTVLNI